MTVILGIGMTVILGLEPRIARIPVSCPIFHAGALPQMLGSSPSMTTQGHFDLSRRLP
jgi:hypothetical protein